MCRYGTFARARARLIVKANGSGDPPLQERLQERLQRLVRGGGVLWRSKQPLVHLFHDDWPVVVGVVEDFGVGLAHPFLDAGNDLHNHLL